MVWQLITDRFGVSFGQMVLYKFYLPVKFIKMKLKFILFIAVSILFIACQKSNIEKNTPLTNEQRQQKIEAAFGTNDEKRVQKVRKILSLTNSSATVTEVITVSKSTGLKTFAYIVSDDKVHNEIEANVESSACGGVSGGWILHNDGCFYHGSLYTGCNGVSIFVEDANPITDNYIGNEPNCGNENVA